jgi:hypothetical protein
MSTVNAHASSSKPAGKGKEFAKGGGKGKGRATKPQPRMKSNLIKRQQGDEELKDLQARIDAFVSDCQQSVNGADVQVPTSTLETFSQLPLSRRTLKGQFPTLLRVHQLTTRSEIIPLPQPYSNPDSINSRFTPDPRCSGISKNRIRQNPSVPHPPS